jgi:hypothetical protein
MLIQTHDRPEKPRPRMSRKHNRRFARCPSWVAMSTRAECEFSLSIPLKMGNGSFSIVRYLKRERRVEWPACFARQERWRFLRDPDDRPGLRRP